VRAGLLGEPGVILILALYAFALVSDFLLIQVRNWGPKVKWFYFASPLPVLILASSSYGFPRSVLSEFLLAALALLTFVALPIWLMALFQRVIVGAIKLSKLLRSQFLD
jgi:hypothetical protein